MNKEKYYWLNKDSRKFLSRGYLSDGESPEDRIRVMALAAQNILLEEFRDGPQTSIEDYQFLTEFTEKFEEYAALGWYSFSTPVWINFGNDRGLPISCFGSHISDSIESFLLKQAEVGMMTKGGGGTSGYFGDVRPRGAKINSGGVAEGPVKAMELFYHVTNIISQGSARRGHFAAYLPIDHPDIEEFLRIEGTGHAIQKMSIGVCVSDEWMQSMILGDKEKRRIWGKVIEKKFESGYPYIFFTDNVNNNKPQVYKDLGMKINASNMCVVGSELVSTSRGVFTVKQLHDYGDVTPLVLFDGEKQVNSSPMRLIERDVEVFKITLNNGMTHTVTSYHKVKTARGLVECKDLLVWSDFVAIQSKASGFCKNGSYLKHSKEKIKFNDEMEAKRAQVTFAAAGVSCLLDGEFIDLNYETDGYERIVSIEPAGREDVYCPTVDSEEHLWVCNGIITANCNEIMLPSSPDESFVCNLSSMNLLHYDDWKNTDAVKVLVFFLDAIMSEFIRKTKDVPLMAAPHRFAVRHRALGVGGLGWHDFLQSKMIPMESIEAKGYNNEIWKNIRTQTDLATESLAKLLGEPELLKGYGRRNTTTLAIAPTTSSSAILGQVSPSIEALESNYFVKDLAKGKFTYKNPHLVILLKEKGKNEPEVWKSILMKGGSVQHLDFLSEHEKSVFKTFGEISQREIILQAAMRQKYIDQGQSLNIMVPSGTKAKDVNKLMIFAWEQGIKGLYYQRGGNSAQELARDIMSCPSCE